MRTARKNDVSRQVSAAGYRWRACVVGLLAMALAYGVVLLGPPACESAEPTQPPVQYLYDSALPTGAIGVQQLHSGRPLAGYFQPVEIRAPQGVLVSAAVQGQFDPPQPAPRTFGMLIGQVYRLRVMNIHLQEGMEVYPTVEVIERLYPPTGRELQFPIPVELTQEDLELALAGKLVTRVVYLENPRDTLARRENPREQEWVDIGPNHDPLAVADTLGRPVAILRLGSRVPENTAAPDPMFLYGSPPIACFDQKTDRPRMRFPEIPATPDPAAPGAGDADPSAAPAGPPITQFPLMPIRPASTSDGDQSVPTGWRPKRSSHWSPARRLPVGQLYQ